VTQHELAAVPFVGRLVVGAALGVIIGLERQRRQSAAGIHTTALVATGSALFAMIEPLLADGDGTNSSRVLANIVTGVGFLAGGVILKDGANVRGLNTAATIWATAAVGALAGVGLYWEAAAGALAIVALNMLVQPVLRLVNRHSRPNREVATVYALTVDCSPDVETDVRTVVVEAVSDSALTLRSLSGTPNERGGRRIDAELIQPIRDDRTFEALAKRLTAQPGIETVSWSAREL
jgi:putative Mg2+ transporter-C (MgtC) family protein